MKSIIVNDKEFSLLISEREIEKKTIAISRKLNSEYKNKSPLFVAILNGAFIFASNLFQNLTIDCEISFLKVASYDGVSSAGPLKILIGLRENVANRNVVIIEDIIDTGNTIRQVLRQIKKLKPLNIKVVTLLYKPKSIKYKYEPDFAAFEVGNRFYVGYGLDYNGLGRNLRGIYKMEK